MSGSVSVLVANEGAEVKECIVTDDDMVAQTLYDVLRGIYGGANVCRCSRYVNDVPFSLVRTMVGRLAELSGSDRLT